MSEELISKRDILEKYGISYGALYRWKRIGLIPEGWFLKKSTSTGQETFFRREQICSRIELILQKKEEVSLEELAASLEEHRQAGRASRTIIVQSRLSTQVFALEDLGAIILTEGEKKEDILNMLKEMSL